MAQFWPIPVCKVPPIVIFRTKLFSHVFPIKIHITAKFHDDSMKNDHFLDEKPKFGSPEFLVEFSQVIPLLPLF